MKLDWKKIWEKFDEWYEKQNPDSWDWEIQQKKIQALVSAEIRRTT